MFACLRAQSVRCTTMSCCSGESRRRSASRPTSCGWCPVEADSPASEPRRAMPRLGSSSLGFSKAGISSPASFPATTKRGMHGTALVK